MKKIILLCCAFACMVQSVVNSQVPGMFNYQAVARNTEGIPLGNQSLQVRIGIHEGSPEGSLVWEEQHSVLTSEFGLFSCMVGDPEAQKTGGNLAGIDEIDWSSGEWFLSVMIDAGTGYKEVGTSPILPVPIAMLARNVVNADDADADPANELQELSISGNQISISGGNTIILPTGEIDLDPDPTNELQSLSLSGNDLNISGGTGVTLPDVSSTNEIQTLSLTGSSLSISSGNSITLPDASVTNELQNLSLSGANLSISGGTGVTLPDGSPTNEIQTLALSGSSLSISSGNSITLPDASVTNELQNLSLSGANLSISGGTGVTLPDGSPTNEIQTLALSGSSLSISSGNSITLPDASVTNEIQNLSLSGANLNISGGTGVTLPDASPSNELNTSVTFSGTTLSVSDAGGTRSADLSSLSNYWIKDADSIYYLAGNVGIGTSATASRLSVMGYDLVPEEPLFEVKRKDGQTVFAVYNEGVRVYVEDEPGKGRKGGFAVGGFNSSKGITNEYLRVSPDSVRIYVDDGLLAKGKKGGFAVGGYNAAVKQPGYEYLRVTHDSVRVYVNEPLAKGQKGGFAVGGYKPGKAQAINFMDLTPENYFMGHQAGNSISGGLYNNFIGFEAGFSNTTGNNNSFMGYQAGRSHATGDANTFIGNQAGSGNTSGTANLILGNSAGQNLNTGIGNTFLGVLAGNNFLNGNYNIFIGSAAGFGYQFPGAATGGTNNVVIGTYSGYRLATGSDNVFLGNFAGLSNSSGTNNVFQGYQSGLNNTSGSNNIFIGTQAGYINSTGYLNVFVGTRSGYTNSNGFENTFIGYESGYSTTTGPANTFVGTNAGRSNTNGYSNTFIGREAGKNNTSGYWNVFTGIGAGLGNTTGAYNTYLGWIAGYANTNGFGNVMVGGSSGVAMTAGDDNVLIGPYAGSSLTSGYGNVFLGPYAGSSETVTSNKLYIENSSFNSSNALVYGDFYNDYLRLNAIVDIRNYLNFPNSGAVLFVGGREALWFNGTYFSWGFGGTYNYFGSRVTIGYPANPGYMLYVQGTGASTGGWATLSDIRYKTNIHPVENVIPGLEKIRSVYYTWRNEDYPAMDWNEETQIGFIAQEVEAVFPEMVETDMNGYKSLDYSKMTVVLLQAIKEQQAIIEEQGERITALERQTSDLIRWKESSTTGNSRNYDSVRRNRQKGK